MNETSSSSDNQTVPPTPTESVPAAIAPAAARSPTAARLIYVLLAVLAVALAVQWWSANRQLRQVRGELAQRLQTGETVNNETKVIARTVQESVKELQNKLSVLENRQAEAQSQQMALEQLYQELAKSRDDWALAEIEQVLSTAGQQLQLAGNVQGALIALQNADRLLSRSDKPQFIVIRRAIARDQEKLKSLPSVDLTGIALRLDSVIGQVESMRLLSDEKPAVPASQPKNARPRAAPEPAGADQGQSDWTTALRDRWDSWSHEMWTEIKQLIRVRQVDNPDALLLSPSQAYFARENLKLRLLNARLALLSRNETAFRSDLEAAQEIIAKYFDTRAKQTQTAQALLKQVQGSNLSIEMPTLTDSLNAVRNYKAKP